LQLPMPALQERIDAELQSNPVLELKEAASDEEAPPAEPDYADDRGEQPLVVDDSNGNQEDFQRLAEFEDEYGPELIQPDGPYYSRRSDDRDPKMEAMANTPAPGESLNEHLLGQWAFVEADDAVKAAGRLIINFIEDDGYLRTDLEELPHRTNEPVTMEALTEALRRIQQLDPTGVGARDLAECLLIQLRAEAAAGRDVSLETQIVSRHLRDVAMNRLPQIAKKTGRSVEEIKSAIENILRLNPSPGHLVGGRTVPVISPDAFVDIDDNGEVVVEMADGNSPRLRISRSYRRLVRNRKIGRDAKKFLQDNIRSAQWLISAIRQRRQTVRRVIEEVFKVQRDFLEHGREALKPLPMADVARKVGVHVATVSRAVAGKHVQTPRGIFPLRMFFSGGTTTADGRDVSWDAVKATLKQVVDAEDKTHPLNDDQLAAELKKRGIDIARRTVAKYRKLLDIPPARKRRQY
ncbi:MAG: RNA polymerase factor sigma-54, partial [Planctomycetes bacterium]|nr:RNA polymerase factor sigma-54 [Planctomycetota bacterium]